MDYNTTRKRLILPEYGRGVQQMVDHLATVPDRNERSRMAKTIVGIMGNMNPQIREQGDYKHKLWDHLFIMAGFQLDIDAPYPAPSREAYSMQPEKVPYRRNTIRHRHYGHIAEELVQATVKLSNEEERNAIKIMIANQMKRSNIAWNSPSVADEDIFSDLNEMSQGKLTIAPGTKLLDAKDLRLTPNSGSPSGGGKKKKKRKK